MDRSSQQIISLPHCRLLCGRYCCKILSRWRRYNLSKGLFYSSYSKSGSYSAIIYELVHPLVGQSSWVFTWNLHLLPIIRAHELHLRNILICISIWNLSKTLLRFERLLDKQIFNEFHLDICITIATWRLFKFFALESQLKIDLYPSCLFKSNIYSLMILHQIIIIEMNKYKKQSFYELIIIFLNSSVAAFPLLHFTFYNLNQKFISI